MNVILHFFVSVIYILYYLFVGDIPLNISIRENSDEGTPIVVSKPESAEVIYDHDNVYFKLYLNFDGFLYVYDQYVVVNSL